MTAGNSNITLRVKAPDTASDSIWYKIDSGTFTAWFIPSTGENWQDVTITTGSLVSGTHALTFAYRDGPMKIDKITVTE